MADESTAVPGSRGMSQLKKYLKRTGWSFLVNETGGIRGLWGGNGVNWHWSARVIPDGRVLIFYGYCPVFVPAERRVVAVEYLTRANWGIFFGTFEMDWNDGQVCCRTSILLGPSGTVEYALERLVRSNCWTMERYVPGLIAVATGGKSPEEALAEAERDLPAPPGPSPAPAEPLLQAEPGSAQPVWPNRFSASEN